MIGNKELRKWAVWEQGAREEIVIPEQDGLPRELTVKQGTFLMPEFFVAEVPDVTFRGSVGIGYKQGDIILESAYCGRIDCLTRNGSYVAEAAQFKDHIPVSYDCILPLVGVWSDEYFHWVLEFFPKVNDARNGPMPLILLSAYPPSFVTEMLDIAGFGFRSEMLYGAYHARKALIPTTRRWKGYTSPQSVAWVVKTMTEHIDAVSGGATHFYLSRKNNVKARRVENEDEILPVLRGYGFYEMDPGDFTVAEQIALFQNAEVIVGPHGGGMTNMIYADKCSILEFFPPSYINPCMYTLAVSQGYDYDCIVAELHGREDLIVDPGELDDKLRQICG